MISSSETRIMSSGCRYYFIAEKFLSPRFTRSPSATVTGGSCGCLCWWRIERYASLARQGQTATGLQLLPKQLRDRRVPVASPPPPTGNTRQSRSGVSSSIYLAQVACPSITSQSLYACTNCASCCSQTRRHIASRSLTVFPDYTIVAEYPLTAFFLICGEFQGITMQALKPSTLDMQAKAIAWLPEE